MELTFPGPKEKMPNPQLSKEQQHLLERFECKYCNKKYTNEDLKTSVLLYGIFFLVSEDHCYIGTNCSTENCAKTIAVKVGKKDFDHLYELISAYTNQFPSKRGDWELDNARPRYFSSVNYSPEQFPELDKFSIHTWHHKYIGHLWNCDNFFKKQFEEYECGLLDYLSGHQILNKDFSCSYIVKNIPSIGEFTVWWFKNKDIDELIEIENRKKLRIFPRHIHSLSLFYYIDEFCWKYYLYKEYHIYLERKNKERIAAKEYEPACMGMSIEEIIENDPNIDSPEKMTLLLECFQGFSPWEFSKIKKFNGILLQSQESCELSLNIKQFQQDNIVTEFPDHENVVGLYHIKNLKEVADIESAIEPLFNLYKTNHLEIQRELHGIWHKGEMQDLLRSISDDFIQEYIKLFQTQGFCYSKVWKLKEKYLHKVYIAWKSGLKTKKKQRKPSTNELAKAKCRIVAEEFWKADPSITIKAMSEKQELREACDKSFTDGAIYEWIKTLAPNRKPGRRPNKK